MKKTVKKVLTTAMITALCATSAIGISGIAANAATTSDNDIHFVESSSGFAQAALAEGGWHGSFNDGTNVRFYIDLANSKASFYFDDGTCINYHAAFISAISTYKLTDDNGNIAQFRIVERSANHARLQCGNRILTLTYDGINA